MRSRKRSPIWPYLAILACLFVLSISAPRAWERMARRAKSSHTLAAAKKHQKPPIPKAPTPYEQIDESELTTREPLGEEPTPTPLAAQPATENEPPTPLLDTKRVVPQAPEPAIIVRPEPSEPEQVAQPPLESRTADVADAPVEPPSEPAPSPYAWPVPRSLVEQLNRLAAADPRAKWATQAMDVIHEICRQGASDSDQAEDRFQQLRSLADPGRLVAISESPLKSQAVRTRYALTRWLDVWEHAARLQAPGSVVTKLTQEPASMTACLVEVDSFLRKNPKGAGWRKYLQLETLRALAKSEGSADERRVVARRVLDRMTSYRLSKKQQELVQRAPLSALATELRAWAAAPVAVERLLEHLEVFEHSHLASDARRVADDYHALRWSAPAEAEKLSESLDTHYRNANLRVAISAKMGNHLLPQPGTMEGSVDDTIVNVPVVGRSTTFAKLSVKFVPDPRRIRLGLEAHGLVDSDTMSSSGPATFYNTGQSTFVVQKLMVLGPQGLVIWPAIAEAENNYTYLTSLETNFDGVPLVGPLVRGIARSQMEDARGQAQVEAEYKLAKRAREHLDAKIRPLVADAAKRVEKEQMATLKGLGLDLVPLALSTTEERIVARVRLGSFEQLGAHTPRPRAPADSWLSIQLHQSAINNAIEKLDLDGRTFTLPELFAWIAAKLNRPSLAEQDELPDDVQLTFAKQDAVRVRCEQGRAEVTFAFAKLTNRNRSWSHFRVKTYYLPEAHELEPRLVRGRELRFDGRSVKGKGVPLLRAIFSKVLSPNRDLSLLPQSITNDPRLGDLHVAQFAIEDGWIGLAYSPKRVPNNVARRPK